MEKCILHKIGKKAGSKAFPLSHSALVSLCSPAGDFAFDARTGVDSVAAAFKGATLAPAAACALTRGRRLSTMSISLTDNNTIGNL
jgi:hypothetical protein